MIKQLLREELAFNGLINEIDWENTFSDVKQTCVPPEEVVNYLNRVLANSDKKTADREKFDAKYPYIHSKSKLFKPNETNVDIESFITQITKEPNNIINTGSKMLKSGGVNEYVFKTGLPALRGIVYDIENKKFHYINTCPGAGSCAVICYALKGNFLRYPASYDLMTRRLNLLLNNPQRYEEKMYEELKKIAKEYGAFEGYKSKIILRWNDSGDFFTQKYVEIANRVMARLKEEGYNVDSYAYTKIGDLANTDSNFDTTFSQGANKKQSNKVDTDKNKTSIIIPNELSQGLNLMKISDEEEYKRRVANHFKLDFNSLITYEELMSTSKGEEPKWNVIVTNNDGDDAAFRKDVKRVLLKFH